MKRFSLPLALFYIALSVLFVSGSSAYFVKKWQRSKWENRQNPLYNVTKIIQTGPEKEALKTEYLEELLGLSQNEPLNLFAIKTKEAEKKLLLSPLIKQVKVKKKKPDTLYIDYAIRKPIAWLKDYENVAIDEEGYLFPVVPYLSPKNLPEIFLGLPPFGAKTYEEKREGGRWNYPLRDAHFHMAVKLLKEMNAAKAPFSLKQLDLSQAFSKSLGKREIVVAIEEQITNEQGTGYIFPMLLRLSTSNYSQQMGNFFSLYEKMKKDYRNQLPQQASSDQMIRFDQTVVDLRIDSIALVDEH